MDLQGVIFDMDGVLVLTDEYHFQTWVQLADQWGGKIGRSFYERRLRGCGRMDALAALLEETRHPLPLDQLEPLGDRKDTLFWQITAKTGLEAAEGAASLLDDLHGRGLALAVGSSSRNARRVLGIVGLLAKIDTLADGGEVRGKPFPDIFLLAAQRLNLPPAACVVVEDAMAGIEAAQRAGMSVLAVGPAEQVGNFPSRCERLADVSYQRLLQAWQPGADASKADDERT
jgi:beta-phosphoglucomutase family hydrolase